MIRASFKTLPLELKERVVEMVSDQEDAWKERAWHPEECAVHINCLSSLALVNKELRELASKHQFEVLTSKQASKPIFPLRLRPIFAHRVIEIVFGDESTTTELDAVLQFMNEFTSLRTLRLSRSEATESLFDSPDSELDDDPSKDLRTYRVDILVSISLRIETLILTHFTSPVGVAFVRCFRNLKTLGILNVSTADVEEDVSDLASAISSLRRLNSLTIDLAAETSIHNWSVEALAPLERDPPPIQSLQLCWFPLEHPVIHLIRIFSASIKTLCLQVLHGEAETDLISITPVHLPLLQNFILSAHNDTFLTSISRILLLTSAFTHFIFHPAEENLAADSQALLAFLGSQPTLRRFELGGPAYLFPMPTARPNPIPPSSLIAYADLVHSRNLDPSVLDAPHLTPFHRYADLDYAENEQQILTSALGRTLAFGQAELERMAAEGNVKRAVGWVAKLKALESERLAWMD